MQLDMLVLWGASCHHCPPDWVSWSFGGSCVFHALVRAQCHFFAWSLWWLVPWAASAEEPLGTKAGGSPCPGYQRCQMSLQQKGR